MTARGRIVVGGSIAQKPGQAGHAWQYLQYLLGFRRLGFDVLFVDELPGAQPDDPGIRWLASVMEQAGVPWTVGPGTEVPGTSVPGTLGVRRPDVIAFVRSADLLLNVMGYVSDEGILGAARQRVFLDTDPGFGQMWRALDLADVFAGHDAHITIGERIGEPDCTVPECSIDWITTPQPVVLDAWPAIAPRPDGPFTSVARWRGAYGPIDFEGRRYGLRVHEFRRFARLPRRTGERFELALDIDPCETADLALLRDGGWVLTDPARVAATPDAYRQSIARSRAEFMVAKGMYVESRSGWLSERSFCYLASGRPVIAQATGFEELYPTGEGLLAYATLDEAVACVESVLADPLRHAAAARELAEEHFGSDVVLGRVLDRLAAAVR